MGKSSGSQTTKTEPWAEQKPYLIQGYQAAGDLLNTPQKYYPGPTYGGISGTTQAGIKGMTNLAQQGTPQLNQAMNAMSGIAQGGTNSQINNASRQMQELFSPAVGDSTMRYLGNLMGGSTAGQNSLSSIMNGTNQGVAGLLQAGQGNMAGQKSLSSIMNGGGAGMGALNSVMNGSNAGMKSLSSLMNGGGAGMGALNSIMNGSDAGMQSLLGVAQGKGVGMGQLAAGAKGDLAGQNALEQLMAGQGIGMNTLGQAAQGGLQGQQALSDILSGKSAGMKELTNTAQGGMLNSNPYVDAMYKQATDQMVRQYDTSVVPTTDAAFSRAGGLGGGSHYFQRGAGEDSLTKGLGDAATNIYGNNYAAERQLMQQAGLALPQIQQGAAGALNSSMTDAAGAYSGIQQGSAGMLNDSMLSAANNYAGNQTTAANAYTGNKGNAGQAYAGIQNSAANNYAGNTTQAGNAYAGNQTAAANGLNSSMMAGNQGAATLMGGAANDLIGSQFGAAGQIASIGQNEAARRGGLAGQLGQLGMGLQGNQMQAAGMIPGMQSAQYQPSQMLMQAGGMLDQNRQNQINSQVDKFNFGQNEPTNRLNQYMQLIQGGNPGGTTVQKGGGPSNLQQGVGMATDIAMIAAMFSDRNAKEAVTPFDPADALGAVREMAVPLWRYKPEHNDNQPHAGPMAQDFHAATGLGDGKTIHPVDAIGVCLASIQALASRQDATDAKLDLILAKLEAA